MRLLPMLATALVVAGTAVFGQSDGPPRLTVGGEGRVSAVPDMATITLGVSARAGTASAALAEVNGRIRDILTVLTGAGVAEADIQTSDLSLSPLYPNRSSGTDPVEVSGFAAANRVTIRQRDLSGLGAVLDTVTSAGANELRGLSFGLQDPQPAQDAARIAAVAEARRKAALYAGAAGVELGPIVSLSESGGIVPQPMMMREMALASDGPVPLAEGEIELTAQVTLVYEIR